MVRGKHQLTSATKSATSGLVHCSNVRNIEPILIYIKVSDADKKNKMICIGYAICTSLNLIEAWL